MKELLKFVLAGAVIGALAALLFGGCEDRPRTSADGPQLAETDLAVKAAADGDLALAQCTVMLRKALIEASECAVFERQSFQQLQQCRRECAK
jgi:hypothetical protein